MERFHIDPLIFVKEGIQEQSYVQLVYFIQKWLDLVFWNILVEDEQSWVTWCQKAIDGERFKFVNLFEVHGIGLPLDLLNRVQRSIQDKLVQFLALLRLLTSRQTVDVQLKHRVVTRTYDH